MKRTLMILLAAPFLAAACGGEEPERSAVSGDATESIAERARPSAPLRMIRPGGVGAPGRAANADRAADAEFLPDPVTIPPEIQVPAAGSVVPSMIIRTGRARIEIDSLEAAVARVRALADRLGGYVANSSIQAGDERLREATLELKIPAARFDDAVGGLATIGEVEAVTVDAQDVGEEFVDVTARLENASRLEDRLLVLLEQRTGELDDVLMVERELARVRGEIERYEGRLRYLRSRVAVSTLTVNVHEPPPVIGGQPGTNVIVEAFREAWRNFVGLVAAFIASLGILVPLGLVAVGAWLLGRKLYNRRRRPVRKRTESAGVREE